MGSWQEAHKDVINNFIEYLNEYTDEYVLKGGTALMLCYGLDRFSEDIDLDGHSDLIFNVVDRFCNEYDFEYRIAKDTNTVKRCMVHYGENKPLKIEVSCRRDYIADSETQVINGIKVYDIDRLAVMKCSAYAGRDKIRDLYDVSFIFNKYGDVLSPSTKQMMADVITGKGIEQFDYLVSNQEDELIDTDKLAESFLDMIDGLGILLDNDERESVESVARDMTDDDDDYDYDPIFPVADVPF